MKEPWRCPRCHQFNAAMLSHCDCSRFVLVGDKWIDRDTGKVLLHTDMPCELCRLQGSGVYENHPSTNNDAREVARLRGVLKCLHDQAHDALNATPLNASDGKCGPGVMCPPTEAAPCTTLEWDRVFGLMTRVQTMLMAVPRYPYMPENVDGLMADIANWLEACK